MQLVSRLYLDPFQAHSRAFWIVQGRNTNLEVPRSSNLFRFQFPKPLVSPAPQASLPGCCSCAWVAPGGTRAPGRRGRGRCTKASHRRAQGRCRKVQGQNRRGLQGRRMKELLVLCRTRRRKSLQKGLSLRQRRRGSQSCRRRDVASPSQIGVRTTIDALWVTKT